MHQPNLAIDLGAKEQHVLALLKTHTYDEVAQLTGWSRGRIWALALRVGARKTENRIRERQAERRQRQLEALESLLNTTTKADVLDFLDGLPNDSISLHMTSTPYNLGKKYGDCPSADAMRPVFFFHGWLMQVIDEMARTLKPGGLLCLNTGKTRDHQECLMPMDVLLYEDLRRAGLTFQNRIIWPTGHGLTPSDRLADRYETILVFSKGEVITFNPNAARIPQKEPTKRAFKGPNKGQLSSHPLGAHPTDVWAGIPHVGHNHPDAKLGRHPAPFPVKLVRRAILLYTMPGDLTCDVFCGSGSLAVAAKETHRSFTGCDLFYEELRERRLANAVPDTITPLPGVTDVSVAVWQAEARRVDIAATPITASAEEEQLRLAFPAGEDLVLPAPTFDEAEAEAA